jgi:predicted metal-dependent hydrolase
MALRMDPQLLHGIELFNREDFFECHEVLEAIWTPERGPRRLFLQALIHFAVAFYHDQQKNSLGAEHQLRKGLRKLAAYLPDCEGIDTGNLHRAGLAALERAAAGLPIGSYPRMGVISPARSAASADCARRE